MGSHHFVGLGAWGSKLTTIAANRCDRCGFMYVAMNHAADRDGRIFAIGGNGVDLPDAALGGECPGEDLR
jgi:hypothetical protein